MYNRCPLMCDVRGEQWLKYIIILTLEKLRSLVEHKEYLKPIHNNVIYKVTFRDAMFNILEH